MVGTFDDAPAVEQMAAIGRALISIGWTLPGPECGCISCRRRASQEIKAIEQASGKRRSNQDDDWDAE